MNLKTENRRRHARYEYQTEAKYSLHERGVIAQLGTGRILNMSASGLLLRTDSPLIPGRKVEVQAQWPGLHLGVEKARLAITGQVIRVNGMEAAVRILSHSFTSRSAGLATGITARPAATATGTRPSPTVQPRTARAM